VRRRAFVTGLGVVSALGVGVDPFWRRLQRGETGLTLAMPQLAEQGARVVGAVQQFNGAEYLRNERHARILNRSFELLVAAAALAAADASLPSTPITPQRLGVSIGIGPIDQFTDDLLTAVEKARTSAGVDLRRFADAAANLYPLRRLRLLPNMGAALLSIEHNAMGPGLTLVSGHATGLQAVSEGLAMIRDGRVDAVLCGGVDARLTPTGLRIFGELCPLSPSADPDRACRPFDRDRSGVVAGEGAAVLVLEAEESARGRAVEPYAELLKCASAGPTEGGCAESMRRVMQVAVGRPSDVVVAHGEGGIQSDRLEGAALDLISPRCITSLQPAIGHTMNACGAMNLTAACLILADDCVPPIRSLESADMPLPFAQHDVRASFHSVLVNAIEPDNVASSALLVRV
jgi:3-oxoacyl-[acyl-carrier-protein] synthase II